MEGKGCAGPAGGERSTPHDSGADPVERLLAEVLVSYESEGEVALERICARYPEHREALRRGFANVRRFGLVGDRPGPGDESFPERLGEFRLLERLGGGGMGVVFAAEQEPLGRRVALKLVRPENLFFPESRERFRREVSAVARLQHPGIVPVYTVGEEAGIPYFAMELIAGCTLAEVRDALCDRDPAQLSARDLVLAVRNRGRAGENPDVPPAPAGGSWTEACLRIARQVAEALDHAHARGVIHRDVKPSNVAVTPEGRALLLDFGLAATGEVSRITRSGSQPGSLPYMSPEQLRGERAVDRRTDVYSLGVTLYELLTLRPPFREETSEATRQLILRGDFPAIRERNPAVPWEAETVCLAAMDRDPDRRYATAADLARDLGNVLTLRPIEARRSAAPLRMRRWLQRHPTTGAIAVLAATVGLLSGGRGLWRQQVEAAQLAGHLQRARDLRDEDRFEEAMEAVGQALGLRTADSGALELRDRLQRESSERAETTALERRVLEDLGLAGDLRAESEELWPAQSGAVARIRAWLQRGEPLQGRGAEHGRHLLDLRRRSLEYGAWHAEHPDAAEAEVDSFVEEGERWSFSDSREASRHYLLAQICARLDGFGELVAAVRERLAPAVAIEERSLMDSRAQRRWTKAIDDIAGLEVYGGLRLEPQFGLLPLWRNPISSLWEFLHVASGEPPVLDEETGRLAVTEATGIAMVLVPGGTFLMGSHPVSEDHPLGSPHADPFHREIEAPVHPVTLDPFFLSRFEMTQGQWLRCTRENPSYYYPGMDYVPSFEGDLTHPVELVSWVDCTHALARIDLQLPTEAQWEVACRAGTTSVFWCGAEPSSLLGVANIKDETYVADVIQGPLYDRGFDDGYPAHAPVGSLRPNAWGFHDVHGNVWEWCLEAKPELVLYGDVDPRPGDGYRHHPEPPLRTARGGSHANASPLARSAGRSSQFPGARERYQGVRPARAIVP